MYPLLAGLRPRWRPTLASRAAVSPARLVLDVPTYCELGIGGPPGTRTPDLWNGCGGLLSGVGQFVVCGLTCIDAVCQRMGSGEFFRSFPVERDGSSPAGFGLLFAHSATQHL